MPRTPSPVRSSARSPAKPAAPARTPRKSARTPPRTAVSGADAPYHHGSLRAALLEAAERVLERDGLAGLTLRAVAREAGVSHAAPSHHFGELAGLLSELAAVGFRQFNAAMASSSDSATTPLERALARPKA